MFKKPISLVFLLLVVASLLLVSCSADQTAATNAPVDEETTVDQAPADEIVEITYMRQSDNSDIELEYIAEFEAKYPNIKVTVDSVPANDNYNKLVLTTNAGNPPDVFMTFWTASAVSNNLIMSLEDYVDKEDFNTRFTAAGQSYAKYNDTIYAIPWRAGASVFLLNCQMFEDAGVDIPTLGWTWDDFAALSAELTDSEKGTYGFGLVGSSTDYATEWQFWPFLLQAGGKIIEDNRAAFNSEAGVKALEYLISLKPTIPEGFTSMDLNQIMDLMVSDKVASFQDGPWFIGIIQNGNPDFDLCVAPMPIGETSGNIIGGTALGISPLSEHKDEAWKFIEFMTSDDILIRWNEATNNIPPNNAALERPLYQDGPMAVAAQVVNQPGVIPANQYPDSDALNGIMRNYLQAAYLEEMTAQEALDQAAAEWNEILQQYDN